MGQLVIVIHTHSFFVVVRWTKNRWRTVVLSRNMAASSSGDDNEGSLPKYGWRVHLDNTFSHKPQPCYIPRWSQIPRLIGLGWRYYTTVWSCLYFFVNCRRKCCHACSFYFRFMKYASRERKNGRVPFIDPFATNPCRQVYGKSVSAGAVKLISLPAESICANWESSAINSVKKLLL